MEKSYNKVLKYHLVDYNIKKFNKHLKKFKSYFAHLNSQDITKLNKIADKIVLKYINDILDKVVEVFVNNGFDEDEIRMIIEYVIFDENDEYIDNNLKVLKYHYYDKLFLDIDNTPVKILLSWKYKFTSIITIILSYYNKKFNKDYEKIDNMLKDKVYGNMINEPMKIIYYNDEMFDNDRINIQFIKVNRVIRHRKRIRALFGESINKIIFI